MALFSAEMFELTFVSDLFIIIVFMHKIIAKEKELTMGNSKIYTTTR